MKLKLHKVNEIHASLVKLSEEKLPVKVAYRLTKIAKTLEKELALIEEQRTALIKKYGEEDEQKNWKVSDTNVSVFQKEFIDLLNEEVELDIEKVKLSVLETITSNVSIQVIAGIDEIIEDDTK